MLDRVSTSVLGLDGRGNAETFADYSRWDAWQRQPQPEAKTAVQQEKRGPTGKKKLSYLEAREFAGIEDRVTVAESSLRASAAWLKIPQSRPTQCGYRKLCKPWNRRRVCSMTYTQDGLNSKPRTLDKTDNSPLTPYSARPLYLILIVQMTNVTWFHHRGHQPF